MSLTAEQIKQWEEDGYLLLPGFFTQGETSEMLSRVHKLLNEFDLDNHPLTTFETGDESGAGHVGDDYFLTSGDKVSYLLDYLTLRSGSSLSHRPCGAQRRASHRNYSCPANRA